MPKRRRDAEEPEYCVSPERVKLLQELRPEQLWLLSVHNLPSFVCPVEPNEVNSILGVSDAQYDAVKRILEHYAYGIALRGISPAAVTGELVDLKLPTAYAVLLADTANEIAYRLQLLGKTDSILALGQIGQIRKRLEGIEAAVKSPAKR